MKISQFEFLVTREKNIFVYKLFLSLNISDFSYVFHKNTTLPEKGHPPVSQQHSSKNWGPVYSPLFENLVWGSTEGGCKLWLNNHTFSSNFGWGWYSKIMPLFDFQ